MRHLLFSDKQLLESHISLPKNLASLPQNSITNETAFVTGATGFIGGFLVREMIERRTFEHIICLVRAKNATEGRLRLIDNLRSKGLSEQSIAEANLQIVIGDIHKPNFGLLASDYQTVSNEASHVFHFAATMNWITPFNQDSLANIQAIREAISLCSHNRLKKLHYASSMGIWTLLQHTNNVLVEDTIHQQPHELPGGYFQSKWVNEHIIRLAQERGIPANIYRIGDVKGCSTDGLGDPQNFGNLVMQYFIKSGFAIEKTAPEFNFLPVDYLAQAILHLALNESSSTFQFSNPELISFHDIYESAKAVGHEIQLVTIDEWISLLLKETNRYGSILKPVFKSFTPDPTLPKTSFYRIGVDMFQKTHSTHNTTKGLMGTNTSCPGMITGGVLQNYMRYLGETVAV